METSDFYADLQREVKSKIEGKKISQEVTLRISADMVLRKKKHDSQAERRKNGSKE